MCPSHETVTVWNAFDDVQLCGLGAGDVLRTESGFLISGQDFDPDVEPLTPFEAGVASAVALDTEFIGRDVLAAAAGTGTAQRLIGVKSPSRTAPHGTATRWPMTTGLGTDVDFESVEQSVDGSVHDTAPMSRHSAKLPSRGSRLASNVSRLFETGVGVG